MVRENFKRVSTLRETLHSECNKYSRGVVAVAAGSSQYPGAALLAVGGARLGNAGYVKFLSTSSSLREIVISKFPDVVPITSLQKERSDALVVGPGSAKISKLPSGIPVILDGAVMQNLSRTTFRSGSGPIVVTPHEGELRFLEEPAKSLASHEERLALSRSIAARLNVIVVLKGHRTIVASPSGESWVDEIGGPELATAGSGDILAGLIGSILVACKDGKNSFDLVCRAVTLHSRAGMLAKKRYQVVTALEILECLALV